MKLSICLMIIVLTGAVGPVRGQDIAEPLRPAKASDSSPVIQLDIDTSSFRELAIYNNLRFQIDPHGRKYDPRDTGETWTKVEIKKAVDAPGFYVLSFSNAQRRVAYRARPVFEARDYEQALKTYEKKKAEYQGMLEVKRKAQEKIYERFILQAAALGKIDNVDERLSRYDSLARATWVDLQQQRLINIDATMTVREIGPDDLWHFSPPEDRYKLVPIRATYRDSAGRLMDMMHVDVLFRSMTLLGFPDGKQIRVAANGDNMIFGVWQNKLYVLPFDGYHRLHVGPGTRSQTFTMQYVDSIYYDLRYFDLGKLIERDEEQHR
jgi:hypothetical protein